MLTASQVLNMYNYIKVSMSIDHQHRKSMGGYLKEKDEQDNRKQLNACDMNCKGDYLRQKGWGQTGDGRVKQRGLTTMNYYENAIMKPVTLYVTYQKN